MKHFLVLVCVLSLVLTLTWDISTSYALAQTVAKPSNERQTYSLLSKIAENLRNKNDSADLVKAKEAISRIFEHEDAKYHYFISQGNMVVQGEPLTEYVYGSDIRSFAETLVQNASRARKRGDLEHARYAIELAIDTVTLPTQIYPDKNIDPKGEQAVRILFLSNAVRPAWQIQYLIHAQLKTLSTASASNAEALKTTLTHLEQAHEERQNYLKKIIALPKTEYSSHDLPEYQNIYREWAKKWQKDLPELKAKINEAMKKIIAAEGEKPNAPVAEENNK